MSLYIDAMMEIILMMFVLMLGGGNITNSTDDCPRDYYGGDKTGMYDLLDRGWCHALKPDTRQP